MDEVDHFVRTNLSVFSSIRTLLQQNQQHQHLVRWESSKYGGERAGKGHARDLLDRQLMWMPHVIRGDVRVFAQKFNALGFLETD